MKRYITLILCLLTLNVASAGTLIKLTWDAPAAEAPEVTGYNLYRKHTNGTDVTWTLVRKHESTERFIDVTLEGAGIYAISAYNTVGESDFSDEVVIPGRPGVPVNVRVVIEVTQ